MSNEIVIADQRPAGADQAANLPVDARVIQTPGLSRTEIEKIRDTDFDRYEREGLDKQLLRLTKEESGELAPTDPMEPLVSRAFMERSEAGRYLSRSWDKLGSFERQLARVQGEVGALVRSLGDDRHQRAFMARFDRDLPEAVRLAMFDTIATIGEQSFVAPASVEDVKFFSADTAAAQLVKEWGSDAPTRIARIWKKFAYLEDLLGTLQHVRAWYDQLTDVEARTVLEYAAR